MIKDALRSSVVFWRDGNPCRRYLCNLHVFYLFLIMPGFSILERVSDFEDNRLARACGARRIDTGGTCAKRMFHQYLFGIRRNRN
jgi:hypothetical protein